MAVVGLEIQDPKHEERFVPAGTASNDTSPLPVVFHGVVREDESEPTDEGDPTLFFKWYSTLHAPSSPTDQEDPEKYPLNPQPDTGNDGVSHFEQDLHVGTHVLTFTAKDQPGDSRDDLAAVERAGMTGGSNTEQPCVITVLVAQIREAPRVEAGSGQRKVVLVARAPARWAKNTGTDDAPAYELDDDYHEHNTVGYGWMLIPEDGAEPAASWTPQPDDEALVFDIHDDGQPLLRFTSDLPDALSAGRYRIALRVRDVKDKDPERWYHETVWSELLDVPGPPEDG